VLKGTLTDLDPIGTPPYPNRPAQYFARLRMLLRTFDRLGGVAHSEHFRRFCCMHLHLVFVGKTANPEIDTTILRYLERLRHYVSTEIHLVKAEKITKHVTENLIREREGERILDLVNKRGHLVVWDQRGQEMDSLGFAQGLRSLQDHSVSQLWMVIGGPVGVSPRLLDQAQQVIALSRMTFPHDVARLLVLEQLYRAFTILKGEPYHR
jgi:23S rRNA (pseudouridine1915-N3)-methyltransferase